MKKLTLITVCRNAENYIEEALEGVIGQKTQDVEYLVVDGASSDSTVEIVRQYIEDIDYFVSEPDLGIYHAMNKGIRLANAEYIMLVNADDFLEKNVIEKILGFIEDNKTIDIFHGSMNLVNFKGKLIRVVSSPAGWFSELRSTPFKHPTCIVKKEWYERVGLYDESFKTAADYDFMLRSIGCGVRTMDMKIIVTNLRQVGVTSGTPGVTNKQEVFECLYRFTNSKLISQAFVFMRVLKKFSDKVF